LASGGVARRSWDVLSTSLLAPWPETQSSGGPKNGIIHAFDLPYRPCVGLMRFNRQGQVFVGKRASISVEAGRCRKAALMDGESAS